MAERSPGGDSRFARGADRSLETDPDRSRAWLDSKGASGKKTDLSHAQLQGLSLWSADLREADLSYACCNAPIWITPACATLICNTRDWRRHRCGRLTFVMRI
jgi:hypothetical protein